MRGKVRHNRGVRQQEGITPAYAGKRADNGERSDVLQDHPRLCGEKRSTSCRLSSLSGSPPPMRGKGDVGDFTLVSFRITPAYAGKSIAFRNVA